MDPHDLTILQLSGPEPAFDDVTRSFLANSRREFLDRSPRLVLVEAADLGRTVPWLWRLTFRTRGLARGPDGAVRVADRHVVAVRFLPDYLRHADRFNMLRLMEPADAFHPNLRPPAICVQVYPGEPLLDVCESLHALFSWRLRQLAETDALNPDACAWGRANLARLPIDTRPLTGRAGQFRVEPTEGNACLP